jgi:PAT family beta-lactamase induction signal transducer AmpG
MQSVYDGAVRRFTHLIHLLYFNTGDPMNKKQSTLRLVLFGVIYFVQGAMLTYFLSYNIIYLRSFDVEFGLIGLVNAITLIPFVLKIFIGLLSDRVNFFGLGFRKPYIVLGLVMQVVAFTLMPKVNPISQVSLYILLLILSSLGMSTYDTCTDGLSIDSTPESQRGLVQGIMVGGRAVSSIITAYVFGLFANQMAWNNIFILLAVLTALAILLVIFVKEPKTRVQIEKVSDMAPKKALGEPAFLIFLVLGLVYPLSLYATNSMISAFLNEGLGINLNVVGTMLSLFGVGSILGAVIGGPMMKWLGRRTSLFLALGITVAATLGLSVTKGGAMAWVVVTLFGLAFGYYETVFFAMAMDFAHPEIAAFMFSIAMAVGNFGIGAGQAAAGVLVESYGFTAFFLICAVIHLLVIPLALVIFKKRPDLLQSV